MAIETGISSERISRKKSSRYIEFAILNGFHDRSERVIGKLIKID